MSDAILDEIMDVFGRESVHDRTNGPLRLAYLGDAVYELVIRTILIKKCENPVNKLNRLGASMVNARAQARIADAMLPHLSDDESDIYRRGRNAKSPTTAKNADIHDYRKATGLEALFAHWYLTGDLTRAISLLRDALYETGLYK